MAGFRACGIAVMAWWACAVVAHAMERVLPSEPEERAPSEDSLDRFTAELEREVVAASTGSMQQWEDPEAVSDNEAPAPEPVLSAAGPEDSRLSDAMHALSRSIDGLAMAIGSSGMGRPASAVPGSVAPWRAPGTPGPRQRCKECEPCLAKLAAGVNRPPCETWAAAPGLERDSAGRFLPRTTDWTRRRSSISTLSWLRQWPPRRSPRREEKIPCRCPCLSGGTI